MIAPVLVTLKHAGAAVDGAAAIWIAEKNPRQAAGDFIGGIVESGLVAAIAR